MFNILPSESAQIENEHGEIIESPTQQLLRKPILTGNELFTLPQEEDNYLIDRLLWENQIVLLLASEKVGKSILSMQMMCALTCGGTFLEEFDVFEPKKVLYIQAEGDRYETIDRLKRMTSEQGVKWNPDNFYHMFAPSLSLDTQEGYDDLCNKIIDTGFKPDVVCEDPLYMAMSGDLIDNLRSRMFCRFNRELQAKFNCSIIIDHHERRPSKDKSGRYYNDGDNSIMGSFVWKAFPSHIIRMIKKKDDTRVMTCSTQRNGSVVPEIHLRMHTKTPLMFTVISNDKCIAEQMLKIMRIENRPMTLKEFVDNYGLAVGSVGKALPKLAREGKVQRCNPGHRPIWYKVK